MKYADYIIPGIVIYGLLYLYTKSSKLNPDNRDNWIYNLVPEELGDWWHEINNRPRPVMGSPEMEIYKGSRHQMSDGSWMAGATHDDSTTTGGY